MRLTAATTLSVMTSLFLLTACGRNMDGATVQSTSSVGKVLEGVVISSRTVTIKDNEDPTGNVLGGIAGGVAGGAAGSTIGKGSGNDVATVGGVIAGAVLGAVLEDQLSTSQGVEYIVKLNATAKPNLVTGRTNQSVNVSGLGQGQTNNRVQDDVMNSAIPTENSTNIVSVIQKDDKPIANGSKVYVVYRDDRARITPAF